MEAGGWENSCWHSAGRNHNLTTGHPCCELQSFMLQLALDLDSDVPGIVQLMYGWSQRRGVQLGSPVSCQNMPGADDLENEKESNAL